MYCLHIYSVKRRLELGIRKSICLKFIKCARFKCFFKKKFEIHNVVLKYFAFLMLYLAYLNSPFHESTFCALYETILSAFSKKTIHWIVFFLQGSCLRYRASCVSIVETIHPNGDKPQQTLSQLTQGFKNKITTIRNRFHLCLFFVFPCFPPLRK